MNRKGDCSARDIAATIHESTVSDNQLQFKPWQHGIIRIPIKSRVVCGFHPTRGRRNKYVFREMDVYPMQLGIYGNWTEYVLVGLFVHSGLRFSYSVALPELFGGPIWTNGPDACALELRRLGPP
jgi:hypothetical protein